MGPISRRGLLGRAGIMGGALAAGPAATAGGPRADGPTGAAPRLKVIVTGGHPGDPEYGCGGTVARYTDLGHEAVLLYLNRGDAPPERPTEEGTAVRIAEAKSACAILGASPLFAGQVNSRAIVNAAHAASFREILEAERPDVVFTHWPIDNHADHRAISMLTYDAWLKMGRRFALYYYEVTNGEDTVHFAPTHYVDITATEPRKRRACYAHASVTPDAFYAVQDQVTRMRGIERGCRQAEAYIRHVQSPDVPLPLVAQ